jgi:nucleoside-diphosphate-sugar epimerase
VQEIDRQVGRGKVSFVKKDEDPRDYKVSFDKIKRVLGFETTMTVPDGIAEVIAGLDAGVFGDPFDDKYRNVH